MRSEEALADTGSRAKVREQEPRAAERRIGYSETATGDTRRVGRNGAGARRDGGLWREGSPPRHGAWVRDAELQEGIRS